jgi:hypothetical protein
LQLVSAFTSNLTAPQKQPLIIFSSGISTPFINYFIQVITELKKITLIQNIKETHAGPYNIFFKTFMFLVLK